MNMSEVKGQWHVKRGIEVAVAGEHSVLLIGSHGSGKTMIARRVSTLTDKPVMIYDYKDFGKCRSVVGKSTMFVVTMLSCPCGNFTSPKVECHCTPAKIQRYLSRIPTWLLDKVDIHIEVPSIEYNQKKASEDSATIKARINKAMTPANTSTLMEVDKEGEELLKMAILEIGLSARAYDKVLKVARTIALLDNKTTIEAGHISETIGYRSLDRNLWG